ncbi:histidine--tRNA ligase [Methanofollis formosanus]|uniref:Histidine--tRNA ligase n=1 Tax=Methanofollis formosanus TaxID=299308 RepID=A0A8G1EH60_9EURY|nr:histidine--tRNA ligase [Methanofollis formosanus]QYZ79889.1 histidine--tRNA ligase [Methanofollis formosanus]
MLQKPRGTRDFLPGEMARRRAAEAKMREAVARWGYGEVCTPTFEEVELFTIRSGENIKKEMYTFEDKGGRQMTLRPEVTASVARMYVNEGRSIPKPLRWFYVADCFRYERPQKGRYRQFWQFGVELIGADSAAADAEVVMVADDLLRSVGLEYDLKVGFLAPMKHLLAGIEPGLQRQVMGLLDKRDFEGLANCLQTCGQDELEDALTGLVSCRTPDEAFEICGDIPEKERIQEIFSILDGSETEYTLNFGIVRGLDYYTGMVFEGFAPNLGAESQVVGGGNYRLAKLFGGDDAASCGFAIGFDRVMVALGETPMPRPPLVAVLSQPGLQAAAFRTARALRAAGVTAELNLLDRGIGAQLSHAAKTADFACIIGQREAEAGTVTLKDLHTGEQREMGLSEVVAGVKGVGDR